MSPSKQDRRLGLLAIGLAACLGCQQNQDSEFHTYGDPPASNRVADGTASPQPSPQFDAKPAGAESVTTPAPSPAQPSNDGVVLASAQKVEIPAGVTNPAASTDQENPATADPSAANPAAVTPTSTETKGPQASEQPASPSPVAVHDLSLAIPPEPPVAVSLASLGTAAPMPARQMELLIPDKSFKVEGPEGALRVTFDDIDLLKVLNADPVPNDVEQHLPGWLSGLNGKMVRIRGWMFPPNQETDIPAFLFVRDNQICCFGRKPMVYDKFGVRLREGVTTNYILGRPFDVIGRMVVKSKFQNDELFWLYMIEDAIVVDQ